MAYDAVVVPGCETLRSTTLERLEAFQRAGGRLIFLGDAPRYAEAKPDERGKRLYEQSRHTEFSREALLDALEPVRLIDIRDENGVRTDNLLHQLRQDGDGLWLFLAHSREPYNNDVPTRQNIRLTVKGAYHARIYDTLTGDILPANAEIQGDKTVIRATLYDHDSLLLRLDHEPALPRTETEGAAASRPVGVPALVHYVLDEPNALLLDKAEYALDEGEYRPEEEILRADNALRRELGWPLRMDCGGAAMDGQRRKDGSHRAPALCGSFGDRRARCEACFRGRGAGEDLAEREAGRVRAGGLVHGQEHRHGRLGNAGTRRYGHRGGVALRAAHQSGMVLFAGELRRSPAGRKPHPGRRCRKSWVWTM